MNPNRISYYETEAGVPHLNPQLPGVKTPKVERIHDDGEARRPWKRFQMVATLPERDQKAVIRLINSLAAVGAGKRVARAG